MTDTATHRFSVRVASPQMFEILSGSTVLGHISVGTNRYSPRDYLKALWQPSSGFRITPEESTTYKEGMEYALSMLTYIHDTMETARTQYEAEREAEKQRWEAERQERQRRFEEQNRLINERNEKVHEAIKWHLTEQIRLRRKGYKSTVFGTVDHVRNSSMDITTEKGKHMSIYFQDITLLELRDLDGGRGAYTTLYKEEVHVG